MDVILILISIGAGWYLRGRYDANQTEEAEIPQPQLTNKEPQERPSTQDRLNKSLYLSNSQW